MRMKHTAEALVQSWYLSHSKTTFSYNILLINHYALEKGIGMSSYLKQNINFHENKSSLRALQTHTNRESVCSIH